jgi:hypothetical protein
MYSQVGAKAVLLRDLEELQSKRYALENPVQAEEEQISMDTASATSASDDKLAITEPAQSASNAIIKEEDVQSKSPEKQSPSELSKGTQPGQDPSKTPTATAMEGSKSQQGPTPPSSTLEAGSSSKPIGLGINTEGMSGTTSAPGTAGVANSSIDSLFDIPDDDENNNNSGGSDINFVGMDFSFPDANTNTQGEQSQTQHNDFDLTTFGDTSQDFNMSDLQAVDGTIANNANSNNTNKQLDEVFNAGNNAGGAENMDLDIDLEMVGESMFDNIFYTDEGNMGGSGEMLHGEFDDTFFGLDD